MQREKGQCDQTHHDRIGTSCFDNELNGDGVLHMDGHESSCWDLDKLRCGLAGERFPRESQSYMIDLRRIG